MSGSFEAGIVQFSIWLGEIIRSLFPWPAIVLFVLLFPPLRKALSRIVDSLADLVRTLRRVKAAGIEFTLDPEAAREIKAKSIAFVRADYGRKADDEIRKHHVWDKFTRIVEDVVRPLAQHSFRVTIHIEDELELESLYQLVDYVYASEPSGALQTRGRRNSIRFGIIGRAWRLGRSEYDPEVTTDVDELVKVWGMTRDEAARAGRGRRSFAVVLLRDTSGGISGLMFMDAQNANLFGDLRIEKLERHVNEVAGKASGLNDSLARIRDALAQEFRAPPQR